MRAAALALLVASLRAAAAIDAVHKYMEAAPPYPSRPYVRNPLGLQTAVCGTGLLASARHFVNRKGLIAILPVTLGAAVLTRPSLVTRLLLHIICCIGSLLEPYDSLLPKNSFLKFFIRTVQKAKRDYDLKYGLVRANLSLVSIRKGHVQLFLRVILLQVSIDDQTFFDTEDEGSEQEASQDKLGENTGESDDDPNQSEEKTVAQDE